MPTHELEVRAANVLKCYVMILPWKKANKGQVATKWFDCPICKRQQTLRVVIVKNGHTRGQCTTLECVNWFE